MKNVLLIALLLGLVFSFTTPAYSYNWVNLGDYHSDDKSDVSCTVWYDPSTIEKEEGISSVLIKIYYPETQEDIMVWMVIDCEAMKCYLVGALLVDENDKALEFDDGDAVDLDIVIGSGSVAEQFYHMLCPNAVKK